MTDGPTNGRTDGPTGDDPSDGFSQQLHRKIPNLLRGEDGIYRLRMVGDAMRPTYQPGDTLLVEPVRGRLRTDGVYLMRLDDTYNVKRLQQTPDGVLVISDNDAYDNFLLPGDADWALIARIRGFFR